MSPVDKAKAAISAAQKEVKEATARYLNAPGLRNDLFEEQEEAEAKLARARREYNLLQAATFGMAGAEATSAAIDASFAGGPEYSGVLHSGLNAVRVAAAGVLGVTALNNLTDSLEKFPTGSPSASSDGSSSDVFKGGGNGRQRDEPFNPYSDQMRTRDRGSLSDQSHNQGVGSGSSHTSTNGAGFNPYASRSLGRSDSHADRSREDATAAGSHAAHASPYSSGSGVNGNRGNNTSSSISGGGGYNPYATSPNSKVPKQTPPSQQPVEPESGFPSTDLQNAYNSHCRKIENWGLPPQFSHTVATMMRHLEDLETTLYFVNSYCVKFNIYQSLNSVLKCHLNYYLKPLTEVFQNASTQDVESKNKVIRRILAARFPISQNEVEANTWEKIKELLRADLSTPPKPQNQFMRVPLSIPQMRVYHN